MPADAGTLSVLEPGLLDPLRSPRLSDRLPGLATAFDAGAAGALLHRALVSGGGGWQNERCELGHARLLPDGSCLLRYRVGAGDDTGGRAAVVNARLFGSAAACRRHLETRLRPLAERARGRAELRPFAQPVAVVSELHMAASVFPLDADLPTLVDASDATTIGRLLAGSSVAGDDRCSVALARYGRGNRCVLRYELNSRAVYGKIADDDRGVDADAVIAALESTLPRGPAHRCFGVPRSLGYHADLRLLLLESVPGAPELSRLLKAHARGEGARLRDIERTVRSCAEIAAGLHASGVAVSDVRPAAGEIARVGEGVADVATIAPELGEWLTRTLGAVQVRLDGARELPACLCHGDLKHNQILFDGAGRTLVDFDTVCHAEPALDLGHFLGYLRLKAPAAVADRMSELFVDAYVDAAGWGRDRERPLRDRVAAYEALSLLGRAVHSFQKFKPARLALIFTLLEERLACATP
jgi:Phosphotransferase enzyme family